MKKIRRINLNIINFCLLISIGLLVYQTIIWQQHLISTQIELKKYGEGVCKIVQDNKLVETISQLTYEIKRIENIQNERFSMLGWGLSVLFTFIGIILLMGFLNSKATVNNLVHEELDNKHKEFSEEYEKTNLKIEELFEDLNKKKKLLDAEFNLFLKGLKAK